MLTRLRTPIAATVALAVGVLAVPLSAAAAPAVPASRAVPQTPAASVAATMPPSDRLIVSFKHGKAGQALAVAKAAGGRLVRDEQPSGFVVVKAGSVTERQSLSRKLAGDASVASVAVDRVVRVAGVPNDPQFSNQWGLSKMNCPSAWNVSTGAGVTVAVIDTGVSSTQPDLKARLVTGYNVLSPGNYPADDYGHGTAVAGVIAATMNNSTQGAGVAPAARIMPIKALDSSGNGYDSNIITGIRWAVDHGAKVVNLSLGAAGNPGGTAYQTAISYARSKGVSVIAAAGNTGAREASGFYPAAFAGVIGVGATDSGDQRASFSSYGSYVDVTAPGQNVLTTTMDGGMGWWNGTSFASPFVAGLAALIASANTAMTPDQIEQRIESTSRDLGTTGRDDQFGFGRVDAGAAVIRGGGPQVTGAAFTNPVAYDLKSLQSTHFHAKVDTGNAWMELRIQTSRGTKVFTTASKTAGADVWFPVWDGKGPDGRLLPSASYSWQLTVSKGGLSTVVNGKVLVSHIYFSLNGSAAGSAPVTTNAYMINGPANMYVSARTVTPPDTFGVRVKGTTNSYNRLAVSQPLNSMATSGSTWYLHDAAAVPARGTYAITQSGNAVSYTVSVIQ